ncbi:MAG TPA: DEAD/DEAH box helicase, partial [Gemmatimonadales bacterium]|nr:DEAD/DEAH box helicase [Gemmatimonadales bacterium]
MTDTSGRRGGSALAVDLRRARAARRREARRAEPAPAPKVRRRPPRVVECANREPIDCVREWFARHEWEPFPFQEDVWSAYLSGESGLIHAATGTGKTYAAWMGPVLEWLRDYPAARPRPAAPLSVLWITPLRALAGDTEAALRAPVEDLGIPWTVESRTGDTPARVRARQRERLPTALVT